MDAGHSHDAPSTPELNEGFKFSELAEAAAADI
jgi:hypothetical protein